MLSEQVEPEVRTDQDVGQAIETALARHRQGAIAEAATLYRRILAQLPSHEDALHLLGLCFLQRGDRGRAVLLIKRAVDVAEKVAYLANLAYAFIEIGQGPNALVSAERAVALQPDYVDAQLNRAMALKACGRIEDAIRAMRLAVCLSPSGATLQSNLGKLLLEAIMADEAIAPFRRLLVVDPAHEEGYLDLGNALMRSGKSAEATRYFIQGLRRQPSSAKLHANHAIGLTDAGQYDAAIQAGKTAIVLEPRLPESYGNLGIAYQDAGDLSRSAVSYGRSLRLAPGAPRYFRHLAAVSKIALDDPLLRRMEALAGNADALGEDARIELDFALAKPYESADPAKMFHYLDRGNARFRGNIRYDEEQSKHMFRKIETAFEAWKGAPAGEALPGEVRPIFIVGMPRSGTTLVEQIVASHPLVAAGGERKDFDQALHELAARRGGDYPDLVPALGEEDLSELARLYRSALGRDAAGKGYVTDKMPANFLYLGLIRAALPGSRILHCVRDPVDTCVSCYATLFSEGQFYTYDQAELGRYYRRYEKLMDFWRRTLPEGAFLDVTYEQVVDDLEGQARRILSYCGLEWDPACLDFHQTRRPVRTASAAQVRRPIYKSSIGKRERYLPYIGPLLSALQSEG